MPSASAGQTQYDPNVTVFFEAQSFVDKGGWVVFEWEKPRMAGEDLLLEARKKG